MLMGLYGSGTTTRYVSYLTFKSEGLRLMACLNLEKAYQLVGCRLNEGRNLEPDDAINCST